MGAQIQKKLIEENYQLFEKRSKLGLNLTLNLFDKKMCNIDFQIAGAKYYIFKKVIYYYMQ